MASLFAQISLDGDPSWCDRCTPPCPFFFPHWDGVSQTLLPGVELKPLSSKSQTPV
jgi:hypothetical protein